MLKRHVHMHLMFMCPAHASRTAVDLELHACTDDLTKVV